MIYTYVPHVIMFSCFSLLKFKVQASTLRAHSVSFFFSYLNQKRQTIQQHVSSEYFFWKLTYYLAEFDRKMSTVGQSCWDFTTTTGQKFDHVVSAECLESCRHGNTVTSPFVLALQHSSVNIRLRKPTAIPTPLLKCVTTLKACAKYQRNTHVKMYLREHGAD